MTPPEASCNSESTGFRLTDDQLQDTLFLSFYDGYVRLSLELRIRVPHLSQFES